MAVAGVVPRPQLLDFFLKGNLSLEPHPRHKPHDWLPTQGWQDLMKLTELVAARKGPDGAHPLLAATYTRRLLPMDWQRVR